MIENKYKYHQHFWQIFVDFRKAYDSIYRESLYNIIEVFAFLENLIKLTIREIQISESGIQINQTRIKVPEFTDDLDIIGDSLEHALNTTTLPVNETKILGL